MISAQRRRKFLTVTKRPKKLVWNHASGLFPFRLFGGCNKDQNTLKPGKTPSFVANEPQATRAELGWNPTGGAGEKKLQARARAGKLTGLPARTVRLHGRNAGLF
jgi:hypothetical protein